ncbi:MAG: hypothetical protein U0411_13960 [Thermodesulfovibrionales bacterium]
MFLLTANVVENVQSALRDRMEVIEFTGIRPGGEGGDRCARFSSPARSATRTLRPVLRFSARWPSTKSSTSIPRRAPGPRKKIAGVRRKIARETVSELEPGPSQWTSLVEHCLLTPQIPLSGGQERTGWESPPGLVAESGGELILVEAVKMKGKKKPC